MGHSAGIQEVRSHLRPSLTLEHLCHLPRALQPRPITYWSLLLVLLN